jgi:hypothetical protein
VKAKVKCQKVLSQGSIIPWLNMAKGRKMVDKYGKRWKELEKVGWHKDENKVGQYETVKITQHELFSAYNVVCIIDILCIIEADPVPRASGSVWHDLYI